LREVTSEEELTALVGEPVPRVARKVRSSLGEVDRAWIAASPFVLVATADDSGRCDVSPKGDPPGGVAHVLDERTLVVPDRPGNRRVDGFRNVLRNPYVGLLFVVPGRGDTLRVNGRARVVSDAAFFPALEVQGKRPLLALVVDVQEVFFHCSKAFLRSGLWDADSWQPDAVPSRAEIAKTVERPDESLEALQQYYGASYADALY
jgi:PPOX class probable FMN-dependent enzyme